MSNGKELEEELQVLRSIYLDELNVVENSDTGDKRIFIRLFAAEGNEDNVGLTVEFQVSENYPVLVPVVRILLPRGISESFSSSLCREINQLADDRKGTAMLFDLIQHVQEALSGVFAPQIPCSICLNSFVAMEDVIHKTPCDHFFHAYCLYHYLCHQLELQKERVRTAIPVPGCPPCLEPALCPDCRSVLPELDLDVLSRAPKPVAETDLESAVAQIAIATERTASSAIGTLSAEELNRIWEKQRLQGGLVGFEPVGLPVSDDLPKSIARSEGTRDCTDATNIGVSSVEFFSSGRADIHYLLLSDQQRTNEPQPGEAIVNSHFDDVSGAKTELTKTPASSSNERNITEANGCDNAQPPGDRFFSADCQNVSFSVNSRSTDFRQPFFDFYRRRNRSNFTPNARGQYHSQRGNYNNNDYRASTTISKVNEELRIGNEMRKLQATSQSDVKENVGTKAVSEASSSICRQTGSTSSSEDSCRMHARQNNARGRTSVPLYNSYQRHGVSTSFSGQTTSFAQNNRSTNSVSGYEVPPRFRKKEITMPNT